MNSLISLIWFYPIVLTQPSLSYCIPILVNGPIIYPNTQTWNLELLDPLPTAMTWSPRQDTNSIPWHLSNPSPPLLPTLCSYLSTSFLGLSPGLVHWSLNSFPKCHHQVDEVQIFIMVFQVFYNLVPVFVSSFISHQILLKMTPGHLPTYEPPALMQPFPNVILLCTDTMHLLGLSSSLTFFQIFSGSPFAPNKDWALFIIFSLPMHTSHLILDQFYCTHLLMYFSLLAWKPLQTKTVTYLSLCPLHLT